MRITRTARILNDAISLRTVTSFVIPVSLPRFGWCNSSVLRDVPGRSWVRASRLSIVQVAAVALNTATEAGESGPAAFTAATAIAIWATVAVLVLGLLLAWPLDRAARRI